MPEISVATAADRAVAVGSLVAAFGNDPVLRHLFPDDATYPLFAAAFFGRLFDKRVHKKTVWTICRGAAVAMWDAPAFDKGAAGAIQNAPALDKGAAGNAAALDKEQSPGTPKTAAPETELRAAGPETEQPTAGPEAELRAAGPETELRAAAPEAEHPPGMLQIELRATALETELPADALARVNAYNDAVHAALPETPFWYLGVLGTHPQHAGRRWGHALMDTGLRRAAADGVPAILETSNPANVEVYRRAGWRISKTVAADPLTIWIMEHPGG